MMQNLLTRVQTVPALDTLVTCHNVSINEANKEGKGNDKERKLHFIPFHA
jgi:hypothetical protein